ncbi:MAG: hypothetical protein ACYSWO_09350 [Planctomycetota bacterium]|jgi:hypothetical protein
MYDFLEDTGGFFGDFQLTAGNFSNQWALSAHNCFVKAVAMASCNNLIGVAGAFLCPPLGNGILGNGLEKNFA